MVSFVSFIGLVYDLCLSISDFRRAQMLSHSIFWASAMSAMNPRDSGRDLRRIPVFSVSATA